MRLISKYNRANIVAIIIVLLLSAISYYFFIRSALIHQLDKDLKVEEREITDYTKENDQLPEPTNYKDEQEVFLPADKGTIRKFSSVSIFNKTHNEDVSYRQLQFSVTANGKEYKVLVRKSQEETEDLIQLILIITLAMVLILLISLFLVSRFLLSKLWKPFNSTLQQIKQFNLSGKEKVLLEESDINEFKELNESVNIMITRVSQDYAEIKNFTENASHEIQTPLAIIKSKLELLSQSESLKEEQMDNIQSVYEATNRLSKLNQSLILLTKIDNRQFNESEEVDMSNLVNKHLNNYEELIAAKQITLTKKINSNVKVIINESLAEILISNLITNAIKHNVDAGSIELTLTAKKFLIINTGLPLDNDPMELFERFKKDKMSSESLGLGLSIVKKICEKYGYEINYKYSTLLHTTTIEF
ncbi:MAG: HAMP domain-containing histidine kinase [Bacteroidota bacterium]|nr:HAMP domain-containing histidine kinase [Bacteroidota bacterium]